MWCLSWLRNGFSFEIGSLFWGISSTTFRKKIWNVLSKIKNIEMVIIGIFFFQNFNNILEIVPSSSPKIGYFLIIDVTECHINKPKKTIQKIYYSGKKKRHNLKYQVSINLKGQILDVSGPYPGSFHDFKIFKISKIKKKFPKTMFIGYVKI